MRIYADESCTQSNDGDYMVIGAITCDQETDKEIRNAIKSFNLSIEKTSEYHFSKIRKPRTVQHYKSYCDIFFDFYNQKREYKCGLSTPRIYRRICFDALVIEHSKIDHQRFSYGDSQLGFFKFYHTLLCHITKKHYCSTKSFLVTIDDITLKRPTTLTDLHTRLLFSLVQFSEINLFNGNCITPIQPIQPQDSKVDTLLQMADVMVGAVAFAWNRSAELSSSPINAKREVVQHIESKLGRKLSEVNYPNRSFNIWRLDMQ